MSRPIVLVIRAEPGAARTAKRLRARGYEPFVSPVQEIIALDVALPRLSGGEILVVTSPNGARRLGELVADRTRQVWCVGEMTAAIVREAGFSRVSSARGDSRELARAIEQNCRSAPLLHLAGEQAGRRFVEAMTDKGFQARVLPVYRTRERRLDTGLDWRADRSGAGQTRPYAVLVHSAGAARSLARQVPMAARSVWVIAISAAAADPLSGIFDKDRVRLAARPDESALLEALDRAGTNN